MRIRITLVAVVTSALLLALVLLSFPARSASGEDRLPMPGPHTSPAMSINVAEAATRALLIDQWNDVVLWNNTVLWNETVEKNKRAAEAAAAAEEAARQQQQPIAVVSTSHYRGAHSDAWWHGVSICEQGGRNDSFFGYFSIMDGSAGGLDWNTQVSMANGIIARHGDYAWAASCVAAGYRSSPGG